MKLSIPDLSLTTNSHIHLLSLCAEPVEVDSIHSLLQTLVNMSTYNMTNKVSLKLQSFCRSIHEELRQTPLLRSNPARQQIPNDEQDCEKQQSKAAEKQRQQDEYLRLNLKERVVHGTGSPMRIA
jgi:hypothetical protein